MLKPSVQVGLENDIFVAEFWDCLRLDPAPVQELRKQFDEHLRRKGRPDIVVDLLGVGFAGSAALGGFVALQRTSRAKGGRMVFCNVDPTVLEVFRVSRLESLYTFSADRASAFASLTQPANDDSTVGAASPSLPIAEPKRPPASPPSGQSRLRRKPRDV
jgi:stage II sporulation protein AA (anti-sigma F factor antagonist)